MDNKNKCINNDQSFSDVSVNVNKKREKYLEWHEFFMATAFLVAKRSKDPVSQVGACIVNKENKIVATGYNGMPTGCNDDDFPWSKITNDPLESKFLYVCHAEMNAVLNKNSADVKNCKIYVGLFPCNECAKIIIQSGIREVIYMSDKHSHKVETIAAKRMFEASGVKYWQYLPKSEKVVIDFNEINWNRQSQVADTPSCNLQNEEVAVPPSWNPQSEELAALFSYKEDHDNHIVLSRFDSDIYD